MCLSCHAAEFLPRGPKSSLRGLRETHGSSLDGLRFAATRALCVPNSRCATVSFALPARGEKDVADDELVDTCLRAHARIRRHRSRVAAFGCGSSQATTGEVAPRHRWSTLPRCTSDACGAPMGAVGLPGSRKHRASSAAPSVVTERNDRRDAWVGRAATTHSGDATSCSRETVPPRCAPSLASGQLGRYRRRGRCGRIRTRSRGGRESGRVVAEEIA